MSDNPVRYSGMLRRSLAYIMDTFAVSLIAALIMALSFLISMLFGVHLTSSGVISVEMLDLFEWLLIAVALIYQTFSIASKWQGTPGMRMLGIHVIRCDDKRLDLLHSGFRALAFSFAPDVLAYFLDEVIPFGWVLKIVWVLTISFTDGRAGIHDMICDQRVVIGDPPAIAVA